MIKIELAEVKETVSPFASFSGVAIESIQPTQASLHSTQHK